MEFFFVSSIFAFCVSNRLNFNLFNISMNGADWHANNSRCSCLVFIKVPCSSRSYPRPSLYCACAPVLPIFLECSVAPARDIRRRDLRTARRTQPANVGRKIEAPHLVVVAPIHFLSGRNGVEICDIYHDLECCISPKMPTHLYPIKIHSPDEDNQIANQWLVGTTPNDE